MFIIYTFIAREEDVKYELLELKLLIVNNVADTELLVGDSAHAHKSIYKNLY